MCVILYVFLVNRRDSNEKNPLHICFFNIYKEKGIDGIKALAFSNTKENLIEVVSDILKINQDEFETFFLNYLKNGNLKINACYQHCCLQYMLNEKMTNQTLRERFEVEEKNYPVVSKVIKETILAGFIKEEDSENKAKRYSKYLPFWG